MVVNPVRERYRVDLVGLQAACEANYARLMRLLPDMRNEQRSRRVGQREQRGQRRNHVRPANMNPTAPIMQANAPA